MKFSSFILIIALYFANFFYTVVESNCKLLRKLKRFCAIWQGQVLVIFQDGIATLEISNLETQNKQRIKGKILFEEKYQKLLLKNVFHKAKPELTAQLT